MAATQGLAQVLVKKPDGATGRVVMTDDPDHPLAFTDTNQAGVYRMTQEKQEKGQLFAVNLESYESDLTYLDDVLDRGDGNTREARIQNGLTELLGRKPVFYIGEPERTAEAVSAARGGFKLWDWLLLVVLGIALFEPWLANRISTRLYAQRREKLELAGPAPPRGPRAAAPRAEEVRP